MEEEEEVTQEELNAFPLDIDTLRAEVINPVIAGTEMNYEYEFQTKIIELLKKGEMTPRSWTHLETLLENWRFAITALMKDLDKYLSMKAIRENDGCHTMKILKILDQLTNPNDDQRKTSASLLCESKKFLQATLKRFRL